jgi:osmotically-inducible protein OsmY
MAASGGHDVTQADGPQADEALERLVSDELFSAPKITIGAEIVVSVEGGEVTLRGAVGTFGDKREAKIAAQRVRGVKSVKDEISVLGATDADLRSAVIEALGLDSLLPTSIDARSDQGVVTLTGSVESQHQRDAAGFIAGNVPGVVDVANQIDVKGRPGSDKDAGDPDRQALRRIASIDVDDPAGSGDKPHRELAARLAAAARRIERLRSASEAGGNIVQFRMERYLQSLESDAIGAGSELAALTDDPSYGASVLQREVSALEVEVAVAEAKLDAARAEERGDSRGEREAEIRAIELETSAVRARFNRRKKRSTRPHSDDPETTGQPQTPAGPEEPSPPEG